MTRLANPHSRAGRSCCSTTRNDCGSSTTRDVMTAAEAVMRTRMPSAVTRKRVCGSNSRQAADRPLHRPDRRLGGLELPKLTLTLGGGSVTGLNSGASRATRLLHQMIPSVLRSGCSNDRASFERRMHAASRVRCARGSLQSTMQDATQAKVPHRAVAIRLLTAC